MKTKLVMMLIFMSATVAKAEGHEPTKMNFNAMIDENHKSDADFNSALKDHYKKEAPAKVEGSIDEASVDDFITFEVVHLKKKSVAEQKAVIKRVYNSVEPESESVN